MDSLLKSLAKDQQPPESRNDAAIAITHKEIEPMKTSLTIESVTCQPSTPVPNNQVIGATALTPRTPIPPESLKCNILKAKVLEQGKNSNLVSISTAESLPVIVDKTQHASDAATIVSVVSLCFYVAINFFTLFLPSKFTFIHEHCYFFIYFSYKLAILSDFVIC